MNMKFLSITALFVLVCVTFSSAADFGGYAFVRISGPDSRAVVRTPDGEMRLVAPGDLLGDATITEITGNRVVLEQSGPDGKAVLIVTVKDGRQQVRRIQQMPVRLQAVSSEPAPAVQSFGQ
jgi:hypothetical protein